MAGERQLKLLHTGGHGTQVQHQHRRIAVPEGGVVHRRPHHAPFSIANGGVQHGRPVGTKSDEVNGKQRGVVNVHGNGQLRGIHADTFPVGLNWSGK